MKCTFNMLKDYEQNMAWRYSFQRMTHIRDTEDKKTFTELWQLRI